MIAEASRAITQLAQEFQRVVTLCHNFQARGVVPTDALGASPDSRKYADALGYSFALRQAEPFYIAPEPGDLIATAASTMPEYPLRLVDLPSVHGFFYFARAVDIPRLRKAVTSIAYGPFTQTPDPGVMFFAPGPMSSVTHVHIHWLFTDSGLCTDTWRLGLTAPHRVPGVSPDEELDRLFASALAFMRQRVLVRQRVSGDRASRRAAAHATLSERSCIVVTLRKGKSPASSDAPPGAPVDWSCRWWVAGHWRQQPCGEDRLDRRPTWITPYVKGPEDKPVSTKPRLFAVVR